MPFFSKVIPVKTINLYSLNKNFMSESKEQYTKVIGTIKSVDQDLEEVNLGLLEKESDSLILISYLFENDSIAERFYESLEEGQRVELKVKGSLLDTQIEYDGVGPIKILKQKEKYKT